MRVKISFKLGEDKPIIEHVKEETLAVLDARVLPLFSCSDFGIVARVHRVAEKQRHKRALINLTYKAWKQTTAWHLTRLRVQIPPCPAQKR